MNSIAIQERYKPRRIMFIDLWEFADWRVKVYAILYEGRSAAGPEMWEAIRSIVEACLSQVHPPEHYGIGYVIVHLARGADFVAVDWWTEENIVQQRLFMGEPGKAAKLQEITAKGFIACVWEMQVHNVERLAWTSNVLANPSGPDLNAYLEIHFNGYV